MSQIVICEISAIQSHDFRWSFGIVLFEMYSMGEIPFADIEPTELIPHLRAGNRPKRPLLAVDKV